jgi:hypothetical protein
MKKKRKITLFNVMWVVVATWAIVMSVLLVGYSLNWF